MIKDTYYSTRDVAYLDGTYERIKKELTAHYITARKLLDAKLDLAEQYKFNAMGLKVLEDDCEPWRLIECNHLIIKNGIVVGSVLLRVNNNRPTHGNKLLLDSLSRTYELRFKTFAGCDFTVESAGLAITQTDRGPVLFNSGSGTGFSDKILERHWDEFKDQCVFTEAEINNPTRSRKWRKKVAIYKRS